MTASRFVREDWLTLSALRDARGCLTQEGFDLLAGSAPGKAPAELASHVAGCVRCQDRMLAGARAELRARERASPPPPWRIWAVLGAVLLLLISILVTLRRLAAG